MSEAAPRLAIELRAGRELSLQTPSREIQELWFGLARIRWNNLVLVPADEGESAAALATSLADVGRRLRSSPVSFLILADPIDYASAGKIIATVAAAGKGDSGPSVEPASKVITAIQPVVAEPLGLAITAAADAVVVCIQVGRTRLAAVRRTIELIGRERIAGALLID